MTVVSRDQPEPGNPLRPDAARNRERVLSAARAVYTEHGAAFTMEDVAARAGVGVGTVYRRFATKEALIDAVARPFVERALRLAQDALRVDPPGDGLEVCLRTAAEFHAQHSMPIRRLWGNGAGRPARDEIIPILVELLERAQRAGRVRADLTDKDVLMILWTVTGLIDDTGDGDPAVWRRHLNLLLDGMRADGSNRPLSAWDVTSAG
jgi:AcrR family transcriptional regulator